MKIEELIARARDSYPGEWTDHDPVVVMIIAILTASFDPCVSDRMQEIQASEALARAKSRFWQVERDFAADLFFGYGSRKRGKSNETETEYEKALLEDRVFGPDGDVGADTRGAGTAPGV